MRVQILPQGERVSLAMKLLAFHKLGRNKQHPRLFVESQRLGALGFSPGTPVFLEHGANRITLSTRNTGSHVAHYTMSQRRAAGGIRPVLDINNAFSLGPISDFLEAKLSVTQGSIVVTPSIRAFNIRRALTAEPPFKVMEFFAGGGTLTNALIGNPLFQVAGAMEIQADFADAWQAAHPEATLIQSDIRMVDPSDLPEFDVLFAGIPCTDHSGLGRAKKSLAGRPETGNTGDLFVPVLSFVAQRMPLACVFENVPNFGNSLAGLTIKNNLRQLGYEVTETILEPHAEWNEPSDRRRWVMVATLNPGFEIQSPMQPFMGNSALFLDQPNAEQDKADAERIATTIKGLRAHNARHKAMGHGFCFSTLNGSENRIPTIVKSYHKINTGPYVETPFGLRMLRQHEIERIQGSKAHVSHYATAVQILGQGVQTRVFEKILSQLGDFLVGKQAAPVEMPAPVGQLALF